MGKRRLLGFMCALVLACGMLANGGAEVAPPIMAVDMAGREVPLAGPAGRVVALAPGDCEILCALGAGDRLVGRGMDCNYPEEALALPVVQSGATTNVEEIIALQPDLVIMNTMAQSLDTVKALEEAGIPVAATKAEDIGGVYEAITLLGSLTGKAAEAEALVREIQDSFADIAKQTEGMEAKTVYFEVSPLEYGLWTAGKGTFMNEIAEICGLTNIFADIEGWAEVSQEQVLERNPDLIVTVTPDMGGLAPAEEIMGRAGWEHVNAVAQGTVLAANGDTLSRPGPRLRTAAWELCGWVYGFAEE